MRCGFTTATLGNEEGRGGPERIGDQAIEDLQVGPVRTDNGNWAVPGGGMDLGESITDTAVRETQEETGITCEVTGLVGIYTNPRHVIRYTSNNEVRQEFSIVFTARPVRGELRSSSESSEPQWVPPAAVPSLQMHPSMRQRIQHYLDQRSAPYLG